MNWKESDTNTPTQRRQKMPDRQSPREHPPAFTYHQVVRRPSSSVDQGEYRQAPVGPAEDLSRYGSRLYVAFPPFPSVLLLPGVALVGHERLPYRALALVLAGLSAWIAWRVLRHLEIPEAEAFVRSHGA